MSCFRRRDVQSFCEGLDSETTRRETRRKTESKTKRLRSLHKGAKQRKRSLASYICRDCFHMPHFSTDSIRNTGKVLGSGAKGTVYLGYDEDGGRFVAIKELNVAVPMEFHDNVAMNTSPGEPDGYHHDLDDDDARVAMIRSIQNEVELLERAAKHDNVVSYYGSMITAEHHKLALVMEYVSGGSLASIVKRQKGLRDSVIRSYGRDVLLGLQYLHEVCRMCHRDIKPDNILVTPEGRCKVADFGASRALEQTTLLKTCIGTPYYMAPEVVQGEGYDESADIWSFGATLFEMSCGKPPFADISNGMAVMFRVASLGRLPDIPVPNSNSTSSSSSINPLLVDVVKQCCQMPKSARPTAAALLQHPFFALPPSTRGGGGGNVATAPVTASVAGLSSTGRIGGQQQQQQAASAEVRVATPPPQGAPPAAAEDPDADFPFFQQKNPLDDVPLSRRCAHCASAIALFSCDACDAAELPQVGSSGGIAGCVSRFCPPCWTLAHAHQRAAGHVKRPLLTSLFQGGGATSAAVGATISSRSSRVTLDGHPPEVVGLDDAASISIASEPTSAQHPAGLAASVTIVATATQVGATTSSNLAARARSLSTSSTSPPPPPKGSGVRISTKQHHPQNGGVLLPDGTFVDLLSAYDDGGEQSEWTCGRCSSVNDGPLTECEVCGYLR